MVVIDRIGVVGKGRIPRGDLVLLFPGLIDTKLAESAMKMDVQNILERFRTAPPVTLDVIGGVPKQPGLYALYYLDPQKRTSICLKVGKAGSKRKDGLQGRLLYHFRSNTRNTVLARHMEADATLSKWRILGFNLMHRSDRQKFLAEYCYFKAVSLPQRTEACLETLEAQLEAFLSPRYKGRVGGPYPELK